MVTMMTRIAQKQDVPLERQEQQWLVDWLMYHPVLKDFFHKTNNEGKRSPLQGHRLKAMGLRPGVSDIFIYYPTKTYSGLWIEMKRNKKYADSERKKSSWVAQEIFLEKVKSIGYAGFFCYGWIDGKDIVERYLLT